MTTRIHDMQAYGVHATNMDAVTFNLWRRVRLHLNLPARMALPALKSMELVLEDDCWVLVDAQHYELPMIAWLNFQDEGRSSLHTPVECTENYYHHMATQFRERVLGEIRKAFENYLQDAD